MNIEAEGRDINRNKVQVYESEQDLIESMEKDWNHEWQVALIKFSIKNRVCLMKVFSDFGHVFFNVKYTFKPLEIKNCVCLQ